MLVAVVVAETVALVLLGVVVAGLLRSHGEVLRTLHRLGAGLGGDDQAPAAATGPRDIAIDGTGTGAPRNAQPIAGTTLDDETVSIPVTGGRDVLLAFLSGGCETCLPFWEALTAGARPQDADVVVVTNGADYESETLLRRLAPRGLPLVRSSEAWTAYDVPGSPHFVYVDGATGTVVGEGTAPSWDQVMSLVDRATGDRRSRQRRDRHAPAAPTSRDQDEPDDVDAALAAAGVVAGDPRLYADPAAGHDGDPGPGSP
jgi:hypothetical protein